MEPIYLSQIVKGTGGCLISGTPDTKISGISVDSRRIARGYLFIALKGEKFDGHSFVEEALARGATGAIISRNIKTAFLKEMRDKGKIIIRVKDTLKALGDIAKIYRNKFGIPVIAVSGSNGKTTTKEMIGHILSNKFNTLKAEKSFNNFVGVPLTLLKIGKHTRLVVLEMETNLLGGIKRLCNIASPTTGIITNIGDTHLEYLKTKEDVFREKSELIESLPSGGVAVLNSDDPYVVRMKELAKTNKVVTFGIKTNADFSASQIKIEDTFTEFILNGKYKVRLNTIFYCNVYNALAAIAVSHSVFGLSLEEIVFSLRDFKAAPLRMEIINLKNRDIKIINDCYNANPQSMKEALTALKNIKTSGRKIAVLGDMLELGEKTFNFHYQLGKEVSLCKIDVLISVGEFALHTAKGAEEGGMSEENIFIFDTTEKACQMILEFLKPRDTLLIKGSRKMRMETIIDILKLKFAANEAEGIW